jgi:hypothetical protein
MIVVFRRPQGVSAAAPVRCCWDCDCKVHPFAYSPVGHLGIRRGDHSEVPLDIRMPDVNFYTV